MNQTTQPHDLRAARLRCDFSIGESIGHVVIWILLTVITLGFALLVFPYYLNRAVLNRTEVVDMHGRPVGRLRCDFNLANSIGHVVIWTLLILFTLGIAAFFYAYRLVRVILNETRIEYYA